MIYVDGYSIEQYPLQNRIVITLPQTVHTVQDTQTMPQNRRVELTRDELTAILVAVKGMYEWRGEDEDDEVVAHCNLKENAEQIAKISYNRAKPCQRL